MASPKRPEWSTEKVFNWVLLGSFLLHLALFFLVMTVEPPPPPSQEEYATWLKKVTPTKVVEKTPEPEVAKPKKEEKKKEEPEEEAKPTKEAAPSKARRAPTTAGKPGEAARRAEVRQQLSGAGLLATIGAASEEGGLANVFESGTAVSKDLGEALSERGGVRVSGGTRIGKKGALGADTSADIGDVKAGAGGSAGEVGGRKGVVPQAFVKGSEAVLKKGGIDAAEVAMALKRRERGIQQCYEIALKGNPNLQGKVSLAWTIDESGQVQDRVVKVLQNTLGDSSVADCIVKVISTIRFPKAKEGPVPVSKTFEFKSGR